MRKSDKSIFDVVNAAIKRHSMDYNEWQKTRFWDAGDAAVKDFLSKKCEFTEGKIPIIYFFEDLDNWTVFSTRVIYYTKTGKFNEVAVADMEKYDIDIRVFKSSGKTSLMQAITKDGKKHEFVYETGKPSVGAIYAAQTLIQVS